MNAAALREPAPGAGGRAEVSVDRHAAAVSGARRLPSDLTPRRAAGELAAAAASLGLRFAAKGTPLAVPVLGVLAAAWGAYFLVRLLRVPGIAAAWGLRGHWQAGLRWHGATALLLGGAILAWALLGDRPIALSPWSPAVYLAWAVAQQFALQNVAVAALLRVGVPRLVLPPVAGLAFGVGHLPDADLAWLAGLGGTLWTALWLRTPNLWTLSACHALVGALAVTAILGKDPAGEILSAFT